MPLKGKTLFITGASRGIGAAIAAELVKQGAHVVAVARDHDKLAQLQSTLGLACTSVACDLSSPQEVGALRQQIEQRGLAGIGWADDGDVQAVAQALAAPVPEVRRNLVAKLGDFPRHFSVHAGRQVLVGEVDRGLEVRQRPKPHRAPVLVEAMQRALHLLQRQPALLVGFGGLPSLGHARFLGVSAYMSALLALRFGLGHALTAPLALAGTTLMAALFGLIALRATGLGFLMLTLALSQVLWG